MHDYKQAFKDAHFLHFQQEYPQAFKDGFYCAPKMPVVSTSNGLTQYIQSFLNWRGHRATRISSAGRQVAGKFIKSTTRSGTADLSATINGRSVMLEIKIGKDKASEEQLAEQAKERKAGGTYEFIKTPEQFLEFYFKFVKSK